MIRDYGDRMLVVDPAVRGGAIGRRLVAAALALISGTDSGH
jgi:hypothetical protein